VNKFPSSEVVIPAAVKKLARSPPTEKNHEIVHKFRPNRYKNLEIDQKINRNADKMTTQSYDDSTMTPRLNPASAVITYV
jgi:hypothetical protein